MSNVKLKAWGFIASCVFFVVSLVYPCYRVVVEMAFGDPYIRTIRIGTRLIGLAFFLLAVWGIYIALKGEKKLAFIPAVSIDILLVITLSYLYISSQNFDGIFLVFEDFFSYYINDIALSMTTHFTGGFFFNVITAIATGVTGFLLATDKNEY